MPQIHLNPRSSPTSLIPQEQSYIHTDSFLFSIQNQHNAPRNPQKNIELIMSSKDNLVIDITKIFLHQKTTS